jgi:hypothetical protein
VASVRRWIPIIVAFTVTLGMAVGVASGTSALRVADQTDSPPPSERGEGPVAALVDATGAAILLPRPGGGAGFQVVGVRRGAGVAWRVDLPAGVTPLGCVECPNVVVSDARGRLGMISNGAFTWVTHLSEPLSSAIGIPGFAADQGNNVVATNAGPTALRLRLLGRKQTLRITLTRPGVVLPLTRFQQANADIAVSPSGVAVAIASLDALHPGEWRVMESGSGGILLDSIQPADLISVNDSINVAGCVSDDGEHTAFVVPDGNTLGVLSGRTGSRLGLTRLRIGGEVLACEVTDTSVSIASTRSSVSGSGAVVVTRVSESGSVQTVRLPLPAEGVQFCAGTGELVTQGPSGTMIARPGHRLELIRDARIAGCTVNGTAWFVHGRSISWIAKRT